MKNNTIRLGRTNVDGARRQLTKLGQRRGSSSIPAGVADPDLIQVDHLAQEQMLDADTVNAEAVASHLEGPRRKLAQPVVTKGTSVVARTTRTADARVRTSDAMAETDTTRSRYPRASLHRLISPLWAHLGAAALSAASGAAVFASLEAATEDRQEVRIIVSLGLSVVVFTVAKVIAAFVGPYLADARKAGSYGSYAGRVALAAIGTVLFAAAMAAMSFGLGVAMLRGVASEVDAQERAQQTTVDAVGAEPDPDAPEEEEAAIPMGVWLLFETAFIGAVIGLEVAAVNPRREELDELLAAEEEAHDEWLDDHSQLEAGLAELVAARAALDHADAAVLGHRLAQSSFARGSNAAYRDANIAARTGSGGVVFADDGLSSSTWLNSANNPFGQLEFNLDLTERPSAGVTELDRAAHQVMIGFAGADLADVLRTVRAAVPALTHPGLPHSLDKIIVDAQAELGRRPERLATNTAEPRSYGSELALDPAVKALAEANAEVNAEQGPLDDQSEHDSHTDSGKQKTPAGDTSDTSDAETDAGRSHDEQPAPQAPLTDEDATAGWASDHDADALTPPFSTNGAEAS